MNKEDFFTSIFRSRALVIRSDVKRLPLVKKALFGLNLKKMLTNSASELLHIWQPTKKEINSFSTESVEEAHSSYLNKHASLYFGSSLEMREQWCKNLTY